MKTTTAPLVLGLLLALAAPTTLHAEPALGLRASTLGLGIELEAGPPHLRGRVVASGWDQDLTITASGVDYVGSADLRTVLALADFHPGGRGFRLSAGLGWNGTRFEGRAALADLLREEVPDLPPGLDLGTLRGTAEPQAIAPYVGLGFGRGSSGGAVSFSLDVGVLYQGEPEVDLEVETSLPIGQIPGGQQLLEELLAAEEAELAAEVEDYELFPVVALGVVFRF